MRIQRFDALYVKDFFMPDTAVKEAAPVQEAEPPPPPPPPSFSEAQLEEAMLAAKKEGVAQGYEMGYAEAQAQQHARDEDVAKAVASIAEAFGKLSGMYSHTLEAQQKEVGTLALMMAKKIAGAALTTDSVPMLEAMVLECVPMLFTKPRISLEMHPETLEQAHPHLRELLVRQGYEGEILFRPNGQLAPHDIRLDWGLGHAERRIETLTAELEALVARFRNPTSPTAQE